MDPIALAGLGLAFMFLLIILHVPIAAAMALTGFVFFGIMNGFQSAVSLFGTETAAALSYADLAVIPLFLLMGGFAGASGLSADLFRLANGLVGHWRGGLAMATIGGSAGFGAVCGSSIATAATMARVALPEMLQRKYEPGLATGSIAAGGTLGILIPPSTMMVLYCFLTEQSLLTLFMAAVIPGLIAVAFHFIAIAIVVRLNPEAGPGGERASWRERFAVMGRSWGVVLLIMIVTGGIYGGVFTVTEAAAIGAACTFMFTIFRGRMTFAVLRQVLQETATTTAMIYMLLIGASILTYFITITRLPDFVVDGIQGMDLSPILVILILLVIYIILGAIFDTVAAMVLTLPFVFPLVIGMGYDPIWWGVVNVMVIEIGMITPPIGINVFVLHSVTKNIPLGVIYRGITPFLMADIARLLLIVFVPALALWLPSMLG